MLRKSIILLSVFGLFANVATPVSVNAYSDSQFEIENTQIVPTSVVGSAVVFLGGVVAGYILDGVLYYVTGFGYGAWVNEALAIFFNNPSKRQIFLPAPGSRGGSGGFSVPIDGVYE